MKKPINLGEDNQSCTKMCHNPVMHKRSKHIDTKQHFIRERVENKEVNMITFQSPPIVFSSAKQSNIHEYSLCFAVEKNLAMDLKTVVISFYRHNYLNKVGCVNQL